ncbi:patatin-like phospholipase family protein [Streptomyces sp. NPDC001817]|uniref:patatin-like phospholipase family protein n=1 Tax=Streptomyces sp. NPDC001817 TaxID=3154398 RepID=UPI00332F10C9
MVPHCRVRSSRSSGVDPAPPSNSSAPGPCDRRSRSSSPPAPGTAAVRQRPDRLPIDLIVGTSAGAIVGALPATGQAPDRLESPPHPAGSAGGPLQVDQRRLGEVWTVLGDAGSDPAEARRLVGEPALAADTGSEQAHLARMHAMVGTERRPDRALLITAVEATTGEPGILDHTSGASLSSAVAASTAFPAVCPPVTINGRRYMDGGLRSATSADLAAGSHTTVVIEPLAHLFPRETLTRELAEAGADSVVTISPDQATTQIFGRDLHDRTAWGPAYRAGVRQGAAMADHVGVTWHESTATGEATAPESGHPH